MNAGLATNAPTRWRVASLHQFHSISKEIRAWPLRPFDEKMATRERGPPSKARSRRPGRSTQHGKAHPSPMAGLRFGAVQRHERRSGGDALFPDAAQPGAIGGFLGAIAV